MEEKRPFVGTIIAGEPVTTEKAREAGIIKKSKVTEEPEYPVCIYCGSDDVSGGVCHRCDEEQPIKTDNNEQTKV
jgi:hypothetical protein